MRRKFFQQLAALLVAPKLVSQSQKLQHITLWSGGVAVKEWDSCDDCWHICLDGLTEDGLKSLARWAQGVING